jgi:hypothetical protein
LFRRNAEVAPMSDYWRHVSVAALGSVALAACASPA